MNISGKLFQRLNVVLLGKVSSPTLSSLRGKNKLISKPYRKKKKKRWEYTECDYHQERKENTLQAWRNENKRDGKQKHVTHTETHSLSYTHNHI